MYLKIQEKLVFSDLFSDGKPAEISRDFEPTASFILFTCVVLHKPRFGAGQLAIVNTIVPLAFPSIRLDQSEVMNELREIKLLCFHFSTFIFQEKTIRKVPRALIPRYDCSFIPRSPFRVSKIANQSNLLSSQDSVDVSGNEVQILFLSVNFLNISVV